MNSDVPVASTVVWRIDEDNIRKEGITDRFRTALLLRRREDSKFEMRQDINLTVSGFSFDRTLGGNLGKTGQSVIIDPAFKNWHLVDVDTNQLGKVNLDTLVFSVTRRTEETQLRMGRVAVQAEHIPLLAEATQELRQTTIQTAIGAIKRQDTFVSQASAPEPPQPIAVGKYFFAELWNREPISRPTGNAMNLMREPPGTTDQQMKLNQELGVLDDSQLHKYFPYVYEEPALPPAVSLFSISR